MAFQESLQATELVWLSWRVQFYQEIGVYGARMEVSVPIQSKMVSRVLHLGSTALGQSVEELLKKTWDLSDPRAASLTDTDSSI
jgi:hypothetical protein